ncbi:MAG: hypothetical protein M3511_06385, partial [Deinococcota bacterium]|nr:hypothetical protein [Deinococcota bacterium]
GSLVLGTVISFLCTVLKAYVADSSPFFAVALVYQVRGENFNASTARPPAILPQAILPQVILLL